MTREHIADVVIIGSGIAALIAADRLSKHKNVIIITKRKKENSNSILAQGGVASAISQNDHWINHFKDTMIAGNNHNIEEAVQILVQKGPEYIQMFMNQGMEFDKDRSGNVVLGQEGAHSRRRILHAGGDATGKALVEFMFKRLLKSNITILEDMIAVDLLVSDNQCFGVKLQTDSGHLKHLYARNTILAAGGCGGLYPFSSNDPAITGDGLAIAYRAGANLIDLEFVQFHPTMLYVQGEVKGLISEAVRGEGAILVTKDGSRIMQDIHPQNDLAPRDIVSREIYNALLNKQQVFLDISMIKNFVNRFPTITQICEQNGIATKDGKIPVIPGAHFHMGGVEVNLKGQTSVQHLYAVGEAACTGVHGANRLASNSLLEGIVFGNEIANHLLSIEDSICKIPNFTNKSYLKSMSLPTTEEIKAIMMKYVGIVRDRQSLQFADNWFKQYLLKYNFDSIPEGLSKEEITVYNMLQAGWLITTSALMRTESRGGHYRSDFPNERKTWAKKRIVRNDFNTVHNGLVNQ